MMVLWRAPEFSGIIAAKLRRALITHLKSSKGYGRNTSLQERARFNHPQVLLILKRRRARSGFEVLVKRRLAHSGDLRQFANDQRFPKICPDPMNGFGNATGFMQWESVCQNLEK
mgnify:CR=1 FL=1